MMAYAEDLMKLRKRMVDAISMGVVEGTTKDLYEATLIQIMNESERQRQVCVSRADDLRRQASVADGQAAAYTQVNSIIYNVLNSYIMAAEKQKREEAERAAERSELEQSMTAEVEPSVEDGSIAEDKKKISKRRVI